MLDVASWALLVAGSFFCLSGSLGVLRFPDFYTRCHAAGLTDTFGAVLILGGLALQSAAGPVTVRLALVTAFLLFTSPIASHALAKAAHAHGVRVPQAPPRAVSEYPDSGPPRPAQES